ncbi:PREDICTED: serine protease nudel-like [Polistes dominula]|uniref:Serine protease nudel-like n=1 Tax=Polistes dominula TaxID=743375 RepID=A0ABM1IWN9_POLDO|nr:PREDICTED: serine protease nudel-like [Polistes dominula]
MDESDKPETSISKLQSISIDWQLLSSKLQFVPKDQPYCCESLTITSAKDDYSIDKTEISYKIIPERNNENQTTDFELKDVDEETLKICQETASNCETMLQSVYQFLEILSNNEQISIPLSQYLGFDISDKEKRNSKLLEILRCMECKNIVNEIDEDTSMNDEDNDSVINDNFKSVDGNEQKEANDITMMNIKPEPIIKSFFVQTKRDNLDQTSDHFLTTLTNKPTDTIKNDQSKNSNTKFSSAHIILPNVAITQQTSQFDGKPAYNWMPYPTCFYGLPPNYLKIQAENVQVLPPDNIIPWLPVPSSEGSTNVSGKKLPYYCTNFPQPPSSYSENSEEDSDVRNTEKSVINKDQTERRKTCPANTYLCLSNNQCILNFTLCNGEIDCSDGSDEKYCSCTDRIMKDRLCDGYVDCPYGEDEMNCSDCPKDYFSCYNTGYGNILSRCIPIDKRCDGTTNCLNGKDEEDCNLILPTFINNMNVNVVSYTEGYLHKNYKGTWYPVVSKEMSFAEEACRNELKLKNIDKPKLEIKNINRNNYQGTFLTMINNEIKIINSSINSIYVKYTILGIVGGRTSVPEAWPYLIAMYRDGNFHCGGIILNEYWILTAAHCLVQAKHYYEIQAGILRRSSFSPMTQNRIAKNIIIHPDYDPNLMRNDIGLIMLDKPLRFNRWVRPACLPEEKISGSIWNQVPSIDTMCVVLGWGALIEDGPDADQLREVGVPILSNCSDTIFDSITEICAGYPMGGRDACQGDSGGPLLCRNPKMDLSYYVAGIVSHGEGCARPGKPGIYARVSYFLNWIKDISEGRMTNRISGIPLAKCPGFSCNDGKCLPSNQQCDQKINCLNGEDEENCNFWLDSKLFKILLQNIHISKRCDKIIDCEDGTDEVNCTCKDILSLYQPRAICNGYIDCQDKTDENNCNICTDDEFLCSRSKTCIPMSKKCDMKFDCPLKEDESDCLTLSNGKFVNLDNDGIPILNVKGVLTRIQYGTWYPSCHNPVKTQNLSTSILIADNTCKYLGFTKYDKIEEVTVFEIGIDTKIINGTDESYYWPMPVYHAPSKVLPTCQGFNIGCRPVPNTNINVHTIIDPVTGNRTFIWPWLATIFVDGSYRCSAILLDTNWLLSSSACTKNIKLSENYTIALLGYSPSFIYVDGPHQQMSVVDSIKVLNDTGASLIHLKTSVNMTRHVQALFLEKKIYPPSSKDYCVAVGTDDDFTIHSITLKPVLKNCQKCQRCFVSTLNNFCKQNYTPNNWNGVVFCRGAKGWYPSAVFEEKNAPCTFQQVQTLPSIDFLNAYLTQAMEEKIQTYEEAVCDGFRCKIGECVPWYRACNGIRDCRDGSDEILKNCLVSRESRQKDSNVNKCTVSQLRCENGECINKKHFCDGKIDCIDGSDEMANCNCASFLKLTTPKRLCDGRRNCLDKSDESPMICPCNDNSFRCPGPNGTEICIPQEFVCDEQKDCPGNEDERICKTIKPFKEDTPDIGEVIERNFGVWHSLCYPNPITTNEDASKICESLGYGSGTLAPIQNDTLPMIPIYDDFYIVRINYQTWYAMRSDKPLIELSNSSQKICHRAFVSCNS